MVCMVLCVHSLQAQFAVKKSVVCLMCAVQMCAVCNGNPFSFLLGKKKKTESQPQLLNLVHNLRKVKAHTRCVRPTVMDTTSSNYVPYILRRTQLPLFFPSPRVVFGVWHPFGIVALFVGARFTLCVLNLPMVNYPWDQQHRPSPRSFWLNGFLPPYAF